MYHEHDVRCMFSLSAPSACACIVHAGFASSSPCAWDVRENFLPRSQPHTCTFELPVALVVDAANSTDRPAARMT